MASSGKKAFISDMLIMGGAMLVIRIVGMISNIYFTSVIGAGSTGMYHMIFSLYSFAVTLTVAGTGLAVTRLISEAGDSTGRLWNEIIRKGLTISLTAATITASALILSRELISQKLFGNSSASAALGLLSLSLPAVAVSSVIRGFFLARRKIATLTISQLAEELSSAAITIYLLSFMKDFSPGYMAIIGGISFSAVIAAVFDYISCRFIISRSSGGSPASSPGYGDIFSISLPVAAGAYIRSALVSAESTVIPHCLGTYGIRDPLSEYGIIKGMSIPLMLFPTVFISALANMLIPELANKRAGNKPRGIRHVTSRAIEVTMYFACMTAGFFLICHHIPGEIFYHNSKAGIYLGRLSLLVIPMYLDTVVDSMLKGLNEQVSSLKYNIIDSAIRLCLIFLLIPAGGVEAYIFILYASEVFNLGLSLSRLLKVTGLKLNAGIFIRPALTALLIYALCICLETEEPKGAIIYIVLYILSAVVEIITGSKKQKAKI